MDVRGGCPGRLMFSSFRQSMARRVEYWINWRQPEADSESLTQRNLYILPAADGFKFLVLVAMIWLMGTNYENNLVLLLAFFLVAVFISTIFATHANLNGMVFRIGDVDPVFAGSTLKVPIRVENPSSDYRFRIAVGWRNSSEVQLVDVPPKSQVQAELNIQAKRRGRLKIQRLKIATVSPLGLLRAWSHPMLRSDCIVYPKPISHEVTSSGEGEGGSYQSAGRGTDDFAGLELWQPGVPAQRIAWKQYSAGRGLLEKRFEAQTHSPKWLNWDDYAGLDFEARLSAICAKALEMEQLGRSYGLRIPGALIPPAQGERHLREVLTSLALFPGGEGES